MEGTELFGKAYSKRFGDGDIDWKDTYRKNPQTGRLEKTGHPLAYLNWATAWREMKATYGKVSYGVLETEAGSPMWDVNGYGMVKAWMEANGERYTEIFPIMKGGQNDSMKVAEIDARDINDAIQRAYTKLCARFGIGLYIYEGKTETPKKTPESHVGANSAKDRVETQSGSETRQETKMTEGQRRLIAKLAAERDTKGIGTELGFQINMSMTSEQALKAIEALSRRPAKREEAKVVAEDDLPF